MGVGAFYYVNYVWDNDPSPLYELFCEYLHVFN